MNITLRYTTLTIARPLQCQYQPSMRYTISFHRHFSSGARQGESITDILHSFEMGPCHPSLGCPLYNEAHTCSVDQRTHAAMCHHNVIAVEHGVITLSLFVMCMSLHFTCIAGSFYSASYRYSVHYFVLFFYLFIFRKG